MNYQEFKAAQKAQLLKVDEATETLLQFPRELNGLVNDATRATPEFQQANKIFKTEFKTLQDINREGAKLFKKEMLAERQAKRLKRQSL